MGSGSKGSSAGFHSTASCRAQPNEPSEAHKRPRSASKRANHIHGCAFGMEHIPRLAELLSPEHADGLRDILLARALEAKVTCGIAPATEFVDSEVHSEAPEMLVLRSQERSGQRWHSTQVCKISLSVLICVLMSGHVLAHVGPLLPRPEPAPWPPDMQRG